MKRIKGKERREKAVLNFTFFILLFTLLTVSGCWDTTDIDDRATIIGLGLDAAPNNKVLVSAQIPITETMPLLGTGGSEKPFYTITSIGKTSLGAVNGLKNKVTKQLFYGQVQSVVVNTALAKRGLKTYIGFMQRHPEFTPLPNMVLTETTSQDILGVSLSSKMLPSLAIHDFLETKSQTDVVFPIHLWQFVKRIEVGPADAYLPIIAYDREEQTYRFEGLGVFHRDRLVGNLTENENRMAGMMMGKSKGATLSVPIGRLGEISYRRVTSKCKISILKTQPAIEFLVQINARGFGTEITSDKTNLSPGGIAAIERASAQSLWHDMTATLRHLQSLNSDIIGFGDLIRTNKPELYKSLNWEREFPKVNIRVKVKFILERVGEYR